MKDEKRIELAIRFAVEHHAGQRDKLGAPYILHPLRVMLALSESGARPDVLIAAVLHDVVEDTEATLEGVANLFGDDVAEAVDAVTRREGETYREFVDRAAAHPIGTIVKLADIQDHVRPRAAMTDEIRGMVKNRYLPTLGRVWGIVNNRPEYQ